MTCGDGNFEFLTRPYPYKRSPFQLATGELVAYEGVYFSRPASGLMFEKRLFTGAGGHPIASDIKLYINRDAGLSTTIEPDDDGTIYQSGTPHYADYVLDLRSLITDVTQLHAADSDHVAQQFLSDHLTRARATYDLTSHDISEGDYVHPTPANTVPSGATPPGSSGSIPAPGDGYELGAKQIVDIDVDEIQWQPIPRPKNLRTTTPGRIPTEPIFPAALKGGSLPSLSSLDETKLDALGLGGSASGGIILTGDLLLAGTSLKLSTASGVSPSATSAFVNDVPWALFPCKKELCTYYAPHEDADNIITARGRQGIYAEPSVSANGVYMLAVSDTADTSGFLTQHYPSNYHAISGIDANGHAHNGVHVVDKLIYDLTNQSADGTVIGYSPINGKKVLIHWMGQEAGSKGESFGSTGNVYNNGDNIYSAGEVTRVAINNFTASKQNWATTGKNFSPVNWSNITISNLGPRFSPFTGAGITYQMVDIQAGATRGVISRQKYALWGFVDRMISPDSDRSTGGRRVSETVESHTQVYGEGVNLAGEFEWKLQEEYDQTSQVVYNRNTYRTGNIFSFFFDKKPSNGLVEVNGNVYHQWSNKSGDNFVLPRHNKFAGIGRGNSRRIPAKSHSSTTVSIGFFPSWKRLLYVTTNNQVTVPTTLVVSPGGSRTITFHADLDFDDSDVESFGQPVWDSSEGVNYLFFRMIVAGNDRMFFAHMDTDFVIFRFNQTGGEGFLTGKAALVSI